MESSKSYLRKYHQNIFDDEEKNRMQLKQLLGPVGFNNA